MTGDQQIWQSWARTVHRWGIDHMVAAFLEAAGPMTILAAQIIYIGQPFLQPVGQPGRLGALASLLEDPGNTRIFLDMLKGEQIA
jgi:hypothetical protein